MKIENNTVVYIDYTLKNKDGELIDSSQGQSPLKFIFGTNSIIPGLEKELSGKQKGDSFSVMVPAAEGYGEYSDDLMLSVPRTQFDTDVKIEPGMQFQAGAGQIVTVKSVTDDTVVVDANHPLAGVDLFFDINVVDVAEVTPEDLQTGCGGCGGGCGSCGGGCGSGCGGDIAGGCGGCGA